MTDANVLHLAHFTMSVRDIRAAEAFYAEVMGGDVIRRSWNPDEPETSENRQQLAEFVRTHDGLGRRFSQLKLGSVVFDVFEEPAGPWPELRNLTQHPHYAFEVTSLPEACTRLDRHNIPYGWSTFAGPGVGVYFTDPDGNHLEYIVSRGYPKDGVKIGDPDWTQLQYDFDPLTAQATRVQLGEKAAAPA
jgi:catechol 2,3-dioxygenase-like lactoylglutathione lyase family enzyme